MRVKPGTTRGLIACAAAILFFLGLIGVASGKWWLATVASLGVGLAIPIGLALAWVVMLIPVAVHELGHCVAGWLVGLKLEYLQVGAVALSITPSGRTLRRVAPLQVMNGYCYMSSPEGRITLKQLGVMILGGPVASVLLVVCALALEVALGGWSRLTRSSLTFGDYFWFYWTFCATVLLCASVIPRRKGVHISDAARLISLARDGLAEADNEQTQLHKQLMSGERARNWDRPLLDSFREKASTPDAVIYSNVLSFYSSWDSGDLEAASEAIAKAAAESVNATDFAPYRKLALYEFAFTLARIQGIADEAGNALSDGDKVDSGALRPQRLRAEAAIALAQGDAANAVLKATGAISAVRRGIKVMTPAIQAEIEWNEKIIELAARGPQDLDSRL